MSCPICNSKNTKLFHDKVWSLDNGKVYNCINCELIFIDPMMDEIEEEKFYQNYNEHVKKRGVILNNSIDEFHEKSKLIAQERFDIVKKYFYNKDVLEVGSSTGAFLSLLETCITNACELAIDNIEKNKFDIICMFHVFEHIRNPISFLEKCKKILNTEALIIIEVPSSDDPLISLYNCNEFKDFVFQPMHPMVYNQKSLDYVFEKSGFEMIEVIHHQRYGLDNHLSWFKNKKSGGDILLNELFADNIMYKEKLRDIKKTDTIYYISRVSKNVK